VRVSRTACDGAGALPIQIARPFLVFAQVLAGDAQERIADFGVSHAGVDGETADRWSATPLRETRFEPAKTQTRRPC